jgi:hypothetical protein
MKDAGRGRGSGHTSEKYVGHTRWLKQHTSPLLSTTKNWDLSVYQLRPHRKSQLLSSYKSYFINKLVAITQRLPLLLLVNSNRVRYQTVTLCKTMQTGLVVKNLK